MNSSKIEAPLRRHLLRKTRQYAEIVGGVMSGYLRKKLSVPVEVRDGKIVRSRAGEYPRTETGSLAASVDFRVENRGRKIVLIFGILNNTRLSGQKTSPTVYARYLVRLFKRKMARDAWEDAKRTGALRKALNRMRVPYRRDMIEQSVIPYSGAGAHAKRIKIANIGRQK